MARLRACHSRYPDNVSAAATLAETIGLSGRGAAAAQAWTEAIGNFPKGAEPWWFLELAKSRRDLGDAEGAESALAEMEARFPDSLATIECRASAAAQADDWGRALEAWSLGCARAGADARAKWMNGRAQALFRLWRIDEAMQAWRELLELFPDFEPASEAIAAAEHELGWDEAALARIEDWRHRSEGDLTPRQWVVKVEALLASNRLVEAGAAIGELRACLPKSSIGARLAIRRSALCGAEVATHAALVEEAARQFPEDGPIAEQRVAILLACGREEDAAALVARIKDNDRGDAYATLASWRLALHRDGLRAFEARARRDLGARPLNFLASVTLGDFLLRLMGAWTAEAALIAIEQNHRFAPVRIWAVVVKASALVELRRDHDACSLIDSIPGHFRTARVMELRAWADARRGDWDEVRRGWRAVMQLQYAPSVHAPPPRLVLLSSAREIGHGERLTAFVCLRDERAHLPGFLRHHRSIGVRHFVCVDNRSNDGGGDYLARQPDVTLYATSEHFGAAGSGMRWINELIEQFAGSGWSLFLDVDERFVYPGWERRSIDQLVDYLEAQGAQAMSAVMLDVFPRRLFLPSGKATPASRYVYADDDYGWRGHVRAPYAKAVGGVRARLFGSPELLQKTPLVRADAGPYLNPHETVGLRVAAASGALLHYKLLSLARRWDARTNKIDADNSSRILVTLERNQRYQDRFAALRDVDLIERGVSKPLWRVARRMMRAPEDYLDWMNAAADPRDRSRERPSFGTK